MSDLKDFVEQLEHGTHALALCHLLANRIGHAFALEMAQDNITVSEWRVILTLALQERTSGQEITNLWSMEKMTVNRAITSLERRGLIEKHRNETDRRSFELLLSASGRALYEKLVPAANRRYHKLMGCLDPSQAEEFKKFMTIMIANADEIIG